MLDLNKLSMVELYDIYFKEYGYEPSSLKSKEDLVSELHDYRPVSLRD